MGLAVRCKVTNGGGQVRSFARSIVATIRQPLLLLDEQSVVREAHPAFCRAFHLDPIEVVGRVVFEIDHGRWNVPAFRRLLADVHVVGSVDGFELRKTTAGRRVRVIDARQVRDDEGTLLDLFAIDDVTHRLHAESERQRLHQELETRVNERTAELETTNKELEAFAYSVSHDLRAPLRAIDGFSGELLDRYGERLDERGWHWLRRVRTGTQQMGHLIDDLLQLSSLSRATLRRDPVDLTALATSIAEELRHLEPARAVAFDIQPGLKGSGDPGLIKVVLQNLIGNAWKFTGATAVATIAIGASEQAPRAEYFVEPVST